MNLLTIEVARAIVRDREREIRSRNRFAAVAPLRQRELRFAHPRPLRKHRIRPAV